MLDYKNNHRLIQLYGYETDGKLSMYWSDPNMLFPERTSPFDKRQSIQDWLSSKRAFTEKEMVKGIWLKIKDDTGTPVREFELHSDHRFLEHDLFAPTTSWSGTWQLIGGVLILKMDRYEFIICASKSLMHSGIDGNEGETKPFGYFKVIHLE